MDKYRKEAVAVGRKTYQVVLLGPHTKIACGFLPTPIKVMMVMNLFDAQLQTSKETRVAKVKN